MSSRGDRCSFGKSHSTHSAPCQHRLRPSCPRAQLQYMVKLTNAATSPDRAQRAKIGIPSGFTVNAASMQATTTAVRRLRCLHLGRRRRAHRELRRSTSSRPGTAATSILPRRDTHSGLHSPRPPLRNEPYTWTSELYPRRQRRLHADRYHSPPWWSTARVRQSRSAREPPNPSNNTSPSFGFSAGEPRPSSAGLTPERSRPCPPRRGYTDLADGASHVHGQSDGQRR